MKYTSKTELALNTFLDCIDVILQCGFVYGEPKGYLAGEYETLRNRIIEEGDNFSSIFYFRNSK